MLLQLAAAVAAVIMVELLVRIIQLHQEVEVIIVMQIMDML